MMDLKEIETKKLLKNRIFQILSVTFLLFPVFYGQRENPAVIFQTVFAAVILLGTFALFFLNLYIKQRKPYDAFVKSLLIYSLFIFLSTEILSFFKILNFAAVLTAWSLFLGSQLFIYLSKNRRQRIDLPEVINFNFQIKILLLILAITFFIAAVYPPNNWDSMTYHIPRVEHWIQNKSVEHYETSILRQTKSAPFPGFIIIHGRILSGGNSLMNFMQWLAFAFSLVIVYRILTVLGIDKKYRFYGVLFLATTPMAILQASSTQTDLVQSLFILILLERFLTWKKDGDTFDAFQFGTALGLAVLVKGTAYPLAFIICCVFAVIALRRFRERIIVAILAALIAFAINLPHYSRNYVAYDEPLGSHAGTMSDFRFNSFLAAFPAHIHVNFGIPMPQNLFSSIQNRYFEILGIDVKKRFHYGVPEADSIRSFIRSFLFFHEDTARNYIQMLIVLILGVVLIVNKKYKQYRFYTAIVTATWLVFIYCIPWQPWITRLQLPLFAISAPMFAIWSSQTNRKKIADFIVVIMVLVSLSPLFRNTSRPIIESLTSDRFRLIFNNKGNEFYLNYKSAVSKIDNLKTTNLGIIIGGDSWEYPLFAYKWKNPIPRIIHVLPSNLEEIDESIDVLFVLERSISEIEEIIGRKPKSGEPFVLRRNNTGWEVAYSP